MTVTLPAETDVSSLVPQFETLSPTDRVYIDETVQTSGSSAVDFTKKIVYRLESDVSGKTDMKAVSTINMNIVFQ